MCCTDGDLAVARVPDQVVLAELTATLAAAGVPTPGPDARALMAYVCGAAPEGVPPVDLASLRRTARRRAAREPLEYITGTARFREVELAVGPGVFVPRRESEVVVQLAVQELRAASVGAVAVDLGTGSGAIALALATEVPDAQVYGVEVSPDAFVFTEQNFRRWAPGNGHPVLADLRDALPERDGTVDVVVANPPYIPADGIPRDPEVRLHSPAVALFGGADGLDLVRGVSRTARRLLRPGGRLVLEHGELQAEAVGQLLTRDDWTEIAVHRDHLGRDRVTAARLRQDVG